MCGTEDVNESARIRPEDVEIEVYVDDPQVVERIRASVKRDDRFVIFPNGYKIEAASLVEGQMPNIYDPEGNKVVPGQQTTRSSGWQRIDNLDEWIANYDPLEEFYK